MEVLRREVQDNTVQLTVTSPPYDNLRKYTGFTWDFEAVARELYRVTKPGGVVVWVVADATVNGSETGTSFKQVLFFKECGFNLHDTMIYEKSVPPVSAKRYQPRFEFMFVLSKGVVNTFNPILVDKAYHDKRTKKKFHRSKDNNFESDGASKPSTTARPKDNIWFYVASGGNSTTDKEAHQHPAIFPEQLAEDHIFSWSNPGDTVLDPFLGSGTTGKMALLNSRCFIGCDISPAYVDLAAIRIRKALNAV